MLVSDNAGSHSGSRNLEISSELKPSSRSVLFDMPDETLSRRYTQRDVLLVADPKALQYIFQTATYRFPKTRDATAATDALFGGQGLISSTGKLVFYS